MGASVPPANSMTTVDRPLADPSDDYTWKQVRDSSSNAPPVRLETEFDQIGARMHREPSRTAEGRWGHRRAPRGGRGAGEVAPHEVNASGEDIDARLLRAGVENADFGVWHTAVEARLRVRLVLNLAVALVRTCSQGRSMLRGERSTALKALRALDESGKHCGGHAAYKRHGAAATTHVDPWRRHTREMSRCDITKEIRSSHAGPGPGPDVRNPDWKSRGCFAYICTFGGGQDHMRGLKHMNRYIWVRHRLRMHCG